MRARDGKAVVQQLFDAFNADRFDDWRDLLAPTFTLNDRETTAEDYMEFGRSLKLADSENEIAVDELIEEGERVVARLSPGLSVALRAELGASAKTPSSLGKLRLSKAAETKPGGHFRGERYCDASASGGDR